MGQGDEFKFRSDGFFMANIEICKLDFLYFFWGFFANMRPVVTKVTYTNTLARL